MESLIYLVSSVSLRYAIIHILKDLLIQCKFCTYSADIVHSGVNQLRKATLGSIGVCQVRVRFMHLCSKRCEILTLPGLESEGPFLMLRHLVFEKP